MQTRLERVRQKIAAERRSSERLPLAAVRRVVSRSVEYRVWKLRRSPLSLRAELAFGERSARRRPHAATYARLGELRFELGDIEGAFSYWSRAVDVDPTLLELCERHAYELWQRGRLDAAYELYERAVVMQEALAQRSQVDQLPLRWLDRDFSFVIGTLALLDVYVKQQILADEPLERTVLVRHPVLVGNQHYLDYWRQYLPNYICNVEAYNRLAWLRRLRRLNVMAWRHPDGRLLSFYEAGTETQRQWEAESRPPLLQVSAVDRERGWKALQTIGMPADAWFVVLHVRHAGYHDLRNADISTYDRAIDAVLERDGWVVRIGDPEMPPLEPRERVLDYAHSPLKVDWMDVFLLGSCRFVIGTTSGPVQVPGTFGVPAVQTNWCPLAQRYWYSEDICLPKRYWSRRESRFLSFHEVLSSPVGFALTSETLEDAGVEVVENTPEEIEAIVVEMLERFDGAASYTEEDRRLQEAFARIELPASYRIPTDGTRLGRDFLRANAELLSR